MSRLNMTLFSIYFSFALHFLKMTERCNLTVNYEISQPIKELNKLLFKYKGTLLVVSGRGMLRLRWI